MRVPECEYYAFLHHKTLEIANQYIHVTASVIAMAHVKELRSETTVKIINRLQKGLSAGIVTKKMVNVLCLLLQKFGEKLKAINHFAKGKLTGFPKEILKRDDKTTKEVFLENRKLSTAQMNITE